MVFMSSIIDAVEALRELPSGPTLRVHYPGVGPDYLVVYKWNMP